MFFKKNNEKTLSDELFKNPTSEYRGTPFWAWNCDLTKEELLWQIERLKEMGFGGFHMHTRCGMSTDYLGKEFMDLIKACTQKAKDLGMLAYLYDEDRWPSGSAGGKVTKNKKFCQRRLVLSHNCDIEFEDKKTAVLNGGKYLVGIYDVCLNENGSLASYKKISDKSEAKCNVWTAFCETTEETGWYNGETYVDTLSKEAMDEFIKITYDAYKNAVGEEFGKTVPSIFTDEPQFTPKGSLFFPEDLNDVSFPWTCDFEEKFSEKYGFDILDKLPELFWDLDGEPSKARYLCHDYICERFTNAFADNVGAWCQKNGIALTGHMVEESPLFNETRMIGEAMRAYRSFDIPGIDLLCNSPEYNTAKQVQSSSRQYGKEATMCELYGVTDWDFDFRGHKKQGDWLAALGITLRVPHLSWVSMKGSAKRDYPASINYQSPWYKEYGYIEDHFARVNTAMTRGKSVVNVAVIHPIESYWLHYGPNATTADLRKQIDDNFLDLTRWLSFGCVDFDFICESTLPSILGKIGQTLHVGEMEYKTVIVPNLETMRSTTIKALEEFQRKGGKVIFTGNKPKYVDAEISNGAETLYKNAVKVPCAKQSILMELEDVRELKIKKADGTPTNSFFYQIRKDGDERWAFIANVEPEPFGLVVNDLEPIMSKIIFYGEYTPTFYDTLSGEIKKIPYTVKGGKTIVDYDFYRQDSILLKLSSFDANDEYLGKAPTFRGNKPILFSSGFVQKVVGYERQPVKIMDSLGSVPYKTEEKNVVVLDLAEYSIDGEDYLPADEALRIDISVRNKYGFPLADGCDVQPYLIEEEKAEHFVTLRFKIGSEKEFEGLEFCAEEIISLNANGQDVKLKDTGYYIDKSIRKYALPKFKKGENIIIAKYPIGKRISLEASFLIGDFDAFVTGTKVLLKEKSSKIAFGDFTRYGLPFYGGNVIYKIPIDVEKLSDISVNASLYSGNHIGVSLDGVVLGKIVFEPYELLLKDVLAGHHELELTLYGNRYNTFGAIHNCIDEHWHGPNHWYSHGDAWSYEYALKPTGILKSPVIQIFEK